MSAKKMLDRLKGGDLRSIGNADEVASQVAQRPELFRELILGLWSDDPVVRMRAADAAEKVTRKNPDLLKPHKRELLGLMAEAKQKEVRWHLAAIVPRLPLNAAECRAAVTLLNGYLKDRSSIVKTFALQGLVDLARLDRGLGQHAIESARSEPSASPGANLVLSAVLRMFAAASHRRGDRNQILVRPTENSVMTSAQFTNQVPNKRFCVAKQH
ncbi:MAG: hypothetical protein WB630_14300 [Candidatus Acidiferrales bacterium]